MVNKKYCHICYRIVPMNSKLLDMPRLNRNIKNKQYWHICKHCKKNFSIWKKE